MLAWAATRAALLLCVWKVLAFPGPDVTVDVPDIYEPWFEVLRTGIFPSDDVTWQYPPAAALAVLAPGALPFWDYTSAFVAVVAVADAAVFGMLLYAARRPGRSLAGGWVWVVGVPLLGPTAYARYDLMVAAVAIGALMVAGRSPRAAGALVGFGAMLKVWPVLLLTGCPPGWRGRRMCRVAATVVVGVALVCLVAVPGAFGFLSSQQDRGTEVESLGATVFHLARQYGWSGQVAFSYGSMEFVGRYVTVVSRAALGLSVLGSAALLLWRLRAIRFDRATLFDAAFAAVLLFTTTSRVLSPQYLLWLVSLAAASLTVRGSRQWPASVLVLAATAVTTLEFPIWFAHVVTSDPLGVALIVGRNSLLVAATVWSCLRLWRATTSAATSAASEETGTGAEPDRARPPVPAG